MLEQPFTNCWPGRLVNCGPNNAVRKIASRETPIDDVSGLRIKGITTRGELSVHEAENVRKAVARYLSKRPTRRQAPFDLAWVLKLHKQMFGDVGNGPGNIAPAIRTSASLTGKSRRGCTNCCKISLCGRIRNFGA